MNKMSLVTTCVDSTAKSITDMVDSSREITCKTFFRHVDRKEVSLMLGYSLHKLRGLTIRDDYTISYHKSKYRGKPCYYLVWSAIEYVFC